MTTNFHILNQICIEDQGALEKAEESYGDSWKRRGGVGAFMMLARKWDRIENKVRTTDGGTERFDIFDHIKADLRPEGIIDDIRDLRRYLLLVESEMRERLRGNLASGAPTDAASARRAISPSGAQGASRAPPIGFGGASGGAVGSWRTGTAGPHPHRSPPSALGQGNPSPRLPDSAFLAENATHRKVPAGARQAAADSANHRKVPESAPHIVAVLRAGDVSPELLERIKKEQQNNSNQIQVGVLSDNTPVTADGIIKPLSERPTGTEHPFGYDGE